ncbi:MAG: glycosyltransferase [Caldisphaera sp.]
MKSICLYGTVLNSIDTIETSLKSVFRSDAEIVVVDGGSKDGTYEKLIELSKEFNLKVYRLPGSSRGLGRDYALRKCPENSYASFFDLDDEYNEYYHKSIEWGSSLGIQNPLPHFYKKVYKLALSNC